MTPPLDEMLALAGAGTAGYADAEPFPHAVVDGFFDAGLLGAVAAELPDRRASGWTTWDTSNEWKHVFDRPEFFGPHARQLADELDGSEFVRYLERLTGIDALVPDPHLTAAGYFDVRRGGFLNVHVDFARNPKLALVRRVNVLVYLTKAGATSGAATSSCGARSTAARSAPSPPPSTAWSSSRPPAPPTATPSR
ncbi:MAG: hypothetical protein GEV08_18070 [Acidimicrobiia bacterium]|nr:hypothetical protein [Acidimicrobiia bacterium]